MVLAGNFRGNTRPGAAGGVVQLRPMFEGSIAVRATRLLLVLLLVVSAAFAKKKPNYKYKTPDYKAHPYKGKKKQRFQSPVTKPKAQSHTRMASNNPPRRKQAHAKSLARKASPKTQSHKRTRQS